MHSQFTGRGVDADGLPLCPTSRSTPSPTPGGFVHGYLDIHLRYSSACVRGCASRGRDVAIYLPVRSTVTISDYNGKIRGRALGNDSTRVDG